MNNLKKFREAKGFTTQKKFCEFIGFDQANFSRIESGVLGAPASLKLALSEKFPEDNTEWILSGKGEPTLTPVEREKTILDYLKEISSQISDINKRLDRIERKTYEPR